MPFLIGGLPPVGSERLRARIESDVNRLARALGARGVLPDERRGWPGTFRVPLPARDQRFSLTGVLVLGASLWLTARVLRRVRRRGSSAARGRPALVLAVCVALFLGIVYLVRWQPSAGVPDRLLVPLLAPAVALVGLLLSVLWRLRPLRLPLAGLLLWGAAPGVAELGERVARVIAEPAAAPAAAGVFGEAAALLPPDSRVLLLSSQSSGDYVLFGPARGYSNVVVPWGKAPFDRERFLERLEAMRATHVLVENNRQVDFHWAGGLATPRFAQTAARLPGSRRIPLSAPAMRLIALAR